MQAERAFAQTSITSGTRAAFLEFFAEDGIVFDAGPVNAHTVWEQRPAEGPVLSWGPEIADVSAARDMGYTSGPFEVRQTHESDPVAWGHFVSVWRRNADGTWNVIADGGIPHGPATLSPDSSVLRVRGEYGSSRMARVDSETSRVELLAVDSAYSQSVVDVGFRASLESFVDQWARFYRFSSLPIVGIEDIASFPMLSVTPWANWEVRDVVVSQSGDMGVSYGSVRFVYPPEITITFNDASYYRIWRRAPRSNWRVVIDVLIPIDPPGDLDTGTE